MGTIRFEYDPERNVVFTEDDWEVRTEADVDAFFSECASFFGSLGHKVYMVSHIDGLLVHGSIADEYARRVRVFSDRYVLGFARWGSNSWARMTVRTTAKKAKMLANIFETREEAVAAVTAGR